MKWPHGEEDASARWRDDGVDVVRANAEDLASYQRVQQQMWGRSTFSLATAVNMRS